MAAASRRWSGCELASDGQFTVQARMGEGCPNPLGPKDTTPKPRLDQGLHPCWSAREGQGHTQLERGGTHVVPPLPSYPPTSPCEGVGGTHILTFWGPQADKETLNITLKHKMHAVVAFRGPDQKNMLPFILQFESIREKLSKKRCQNSRKLPQFQPFHPTNAFRFRDRFPLWLTMLMSADRSIAAEATYELGAYDGQQHCNTTVTTL